MKNYSMIKKEKKKKDEVKKYVEKKHKQKYGLEEYGYDNRLEKKNEVTEVIEYEDKLIAKNDVEQSNAGSLDATDTSALLDLIPAIDSTYKIGNSDPKYWQGGYFDNVYLNNTAYLSGSTAGEITTTGDLVPASDNTDDLGSSSYEYKDLYLDGTVKVDGTTVLTSQRLKANYNNWAALSDVVQALVDMGIFDQV